MKNLLPIGSVVLLDGGEKRLMVIGVIQVNPADGKEYDYLACLYPEGFVGPEHTYLFNHDDIQNVDAEGYVNEEHKVFREQLAELLDERATQDAVDTDDTDDAELDSGAQ